MAPQIMGTGSSMIHPLDRILPILDNLQRLGNLCLASHAGPRLLHDSGQLWNMVSLIHGSPRLNSLCTRFFGSPEADWTAVIEALQAHNRFAEIFQDDPSRPTGVKALQFKCDLTDMPDILFSIPLFAPHLTTLMNEGIVEPTSHPGRLLDVRSIVSGLRELERLSLWTVREREEEYDPAFENDMLDDILEVSKHHLPWRRLLNRTGEALPGSPVLPVLGPANWPHLLRNSRQESAQSLSPRDP